MERAVTLGTGCPGVPSLEGFKSHVDVGHLGTWAGGGLGTAGFKLDSMIFSNTTDPVLQSSS